MLRAAPHNCDLIVALTHMRVPNDRILAEQVAEIDFVLGGHDHGYVREVGQSNGVFVVKSGTDFEDFSDINLLMNATQEDYELAKQDDTELT